jgi:1-deoxy-D-xylulose-5-phosphate reductoisomerase
MHVPNKRLDLAALGALTFEAPDAVRFPALRIAREVLEAGGSAGTVLNAANEVAVEAFLAKRIGFLAIARLVEATLAAKPHLIAHIPTSVEDVLAIDQEVRVTANALLGRFASAG